MYIEAGKIYRKDCGEEWKSEKMEKSEKGERKCFVKSPVGYWMVRRDEKGICQIDTRTYYEEEVKEIKASAGCYQGRDKAVAVFDGAFDPLLAEAARQLHEYFTGERKAFDLPLSIKGTDFQQAVWNALMDVPYGETRTYGEIAKAIGKPKAARAVGMANNRNPVSIVIPCHRIIGADGSLTGYGGGLNAKEFLLKLEGTL